MTAPNIIITDEAAKQIAYLTSLEKKPENPLFLRVCVNSGGCSGFQYDFSLDNNQTPDDHIFEKNGIAVAIDPVSLSLLSNATIDYTQDLTSSQFVIKNPQASSSCGCGNSFAL